MWGNNRAMPMKVPMWVHCKLPVRCPKLESLGKSWESVAFGSSFGVGINEEGLVYAWGRCQYGKIFIEPTLIEGLPKMKKAVCTESNIFCFVSMFLSNFRTYLFVLCVDDIILLAEDGQVFLMKHVPVAVEADNELPTPVKVFTGCLWFSLVFWRGVFFCFFYRHLALALIPIASSV